MLFFKKYPVSLAMYGSLQIVWNGVECNILPAHGFHWIGDMEKSKLGIWVTEFIIR